jgi:glycosyltransferase involved in cell wall biosynthesis
MSVLETFELSIIIPCFNQAQALRETLETLGEQRLSCDRFEVIVVDDGSNDAVSQVIESKTWPFSLTFMEQDHLGAAEARNQGAVKAAAEILLFLDADMIASPDLLIEHLEGHRSGEKALVVGKRKSWLPARQTKFHRIVDIDSNVTYQENHATKVSFSEAFSCNFSIRQSDFLFIGRFDPHIFRWEDIDFSYRAHRMNYSIVFRPNALAYHNHPMSFHNYRAKILNHYEMAVPFFIKFPEVLKHPYYFYLRNKMPIRWGIDSIFLVFQKMVFRVMAWRPVRSSLEWFISLLDRMGAPPAVLRFLYWRILTCYEVLGIRQGIKKFGNPQ